MKMLANHFRQWDEDPYRQAHRIVPTREPATSLATDMTVLAFLIFLLLVIAAVANGLNPSPAFDLARDMGAGR